MSFIDFATYIIHYSKKTTKCFKFGVGKIAKMFVVIKLGFHDLASLFMRK